MSSLFDIGRTGLQSYRQALGVTGQNIANVNTDGYKRREASLEEVPAGRGDIYSISKNSGLGVRVADVKRSFDEFLLNKARSAGANAQTSTKTLSALEQLQSHLMPGDSNIGTAIEQFFASLHDISNVPAEMGPRIVAMEYGTALAESFNEVARGVNLLKGGLTTQANQDVDDLNALSKGLLNVNLQLTKSGSNTVQSLLDSRDSLIDKMSNAVEVNVTLDSKGRATVRLGDGVAGPKLVDGSQAYNLRVEALDDRMLFYAGTSGTEILTNQVTNGSLAGIASGYRTVHETGAKIDNLAHFVLRDLNDAHRKGITLDGEAGGDLFVARRPFVETGPANVGGAYAEVTVEDVSLVEPAATTFTYNSKSDKWIGRDVYGNEVASGTSSLRLPGMQIRFFGTAFDNDEITVNPSRGAAESMLFALKRGEEFAAASGRLSYADSANASTALISVTDAAETSVTSVPGLEGTLSNGISSIAATEFLSDGAIAVVPKNADKLDLVSLTRQAEASFSISDADLPQINMLSFGINATDGTFTAASFSLSAALYSDGGTGWTDARDVADLLNVGGVTGYNQNGEAVSLAELGVVASGDSGKVTLALASGEFFWPRISHANGTAEAEVSESASTASNLQIFTRDGRHIAGSALSASEQASLMTKSNGFNAEAQYNSSYLNVDGGYLGVGVTRRGTPKENLITSSVSGAAGSFTIRRLSDIDGSVSGLGGMSAHAESASYTLNIEGFEKTVTVTDFGRDASDEDVAQALLKKFRDDAPPAALLGSAVSSIPDDGTTVSISFENNIYQIGMVDGEVTVTGGESGRIRAFFDNSNQLNISSTSGTISASQISVLSESDLTGNTTAANSFGLTAGSSGAVPTKDGFSAYDYELTINGATITATRTDPAASLTATASATSAASERLILSDLPDEELLILTSGGGARRISASFDLLPESSPALVREMTVRVLDTATGTVEFIDTATGTSLANRTLDANQTAVAFGMSVDLDGTLATGDDFYITTNSDGIGDARNLFELTSLQNGHDGRGGFQTIFANVISEVGSMLQSTRVTNEAAKELHNTSLEIEAGFSGVSLDAEAANLIQQQQAYQASARILTTARQIFQTILDAI